MVVASVASVGSSSDNLSSENVSPDPSVTEGVGEDVGEMSTSDLEDLDSNPIDAGDLFVGDIDCEPVVTIVAPDPR